MIVYKITNKINGKVYIGQTIKTLTFRWNCHKKAGSGCRHIKRAIDKYGENNFEVTVLVRASSREELDSREKFCIRIFNTMAPNGYNLTAGGNSAKLTAETRALIGLAHKGKVDSEETRKKKSVSHLKSKNHFWRKKHSLETRIAIGVKKNKPILCPELGKSFKSITSAEKELGIWSCFILDVLKGRSPSHKGLTFEYIVNK